MSKAELARRASVSPLTINRVENGWPCRMDTKRKILEALGLSPSAREEVFGPEPDPSSAAQVWYRPGASQHKTNPRSAFTRRVLDALQH